jgi:hypothetical protein
MSIHKDCADHLRSTYSNGGNKLGAGHAHELVAAYFGYTNAAALRTEAKYPVADLGDASILIPNIPLMEKRMGELKGLPPLPSADELASNLSAFLVSNGDFSGEVWHTRKLEQYIEESFIQDQFLSILDDVSGETASTNAYFDELIVDEVEVSATTDAVMVKVSGDLNGENDPDKPFSGDKIVFTTDITLQRVAGRVAFMSPELETSGAVDDSDYYDEEAA